MRKIYYLFAAVAAYVLVAMPASAAKPDIKMDICHYDDDTMTYHLINVSKNSEKAHMAHGDVLPGNNIPGQNDKKLDMKCNVVDVWGLVDTLSLDSASQTGVSTPTLITGTQYKFVVSGTWTNRPGEIVDAEYSTPDGWTSWTDAPYGPFLGELLDVQVNGSFVSWGPYSASHEYILNNYLGAGTTVNFRVFDGDVPSQEPIPGWYTDNVGTLTIKVYKMN